jgi:CubicO group peptidase (beta-lactamase class C family)
MATSVEDLARFAMLQFGDGPATGAQILRGSTLREMHRIHWLDPDWQAGWGLGFRVSRIDGKTYVEHGGAVRGYRTQVRICPSDKTAVIALTNSDDGLPVEYVAKAFEWVVPAILKAAKPEPEKPEPDPTWQQYVGKYRCAWGDAQVLVLNGELIIIDPMSPDPPAFKDRLTPIDEHIFRIETEEGYGSRGEQVVFEINENGHVGRLKVGEDYLYPLEKW